MKVIGILFIGLFSASYNINSTFATANYNQCNLPPPTDKKCNNQLVWLLAKQFENMDTTEHDVQEVQRQLSEEKAKRIKSDEDIARIQSELQQLKDNTGNRPAFFVALQKHPYVFTSLDDIIEFDDVQLNRGGGYNPSTGVFTAPRDGIYQFSCTILVGKSGTDLHYKLTKNGVSYVLGYNPAVSHVSPSTLNAVVEMKTGDRVDIRHRKATTEYVFGFRHSSFSGFFLYE